MDAWSSNRERERERQRETETERERERQRDREREREGERVRAMNDPHRLSDVAESQGLNFPSLHVMILRLRFNISINFGRR